MFINSCGYSLQVRRRANSQNLHRAFHFYPPAIGLKNIFQHFTSTPHLGKDVKVCRFNQDKKTLKMIVKFNDKTDNNKVLEIEKNENSISFFISDVGEEQIGQLIEIPMTEVQNLIKYLQSLQMYQ